MGWKELGKAIKEKRIEKGVSLTLLSLKTNITTEKLKLMEKGVFDFDNPFYMKEFLKRVSDVLNLDYEEVIKHYEEELDLSKFEKNWLERENIHSFKIAFATALAVVILIFIILVTIEIEKIVTSPYAYLKNTTNSEIYVNDKLVKPGEVVEIYKSSVVRNNKGSILITEYSGRKIHVKIENFEVIIRGRDKRP